MNYLLVFLPTLAAAAQLRPTIVGGTEVSIEDYPYQIALLKGGTLRCGGSIISPNQAVTAAHCVSDVPASKLSIHAGSSSFNDGGIVVNISSIAVHSKYDQVTFDNDIAIVTLAGSLPFGPGIGLVGSTDHGEGTLSDGVDVVVSGWGSVQEGWPASPSLQVVTVNVVDVDECRAGYHDVGLITESMFCAGVPEGGKDSCHGDNGGPAIVNGVLIGVVSWGHGCGWKGYPGVYSSTAYLRDFIAQMTGL
ncbi:hypothetical protein ASPCAL08710 [Aspergillus calidoustus]|uniref:Peptidase S1 domain-containing protein n=1 Tax=Aspergillus calidoustus TaxID=454130 RepID=A0A0U5GTC1_ASPCI|nr:hypothetical protein ASPCAL08710 [Aspergillus calidoustus]